MKDQQNELPKETTPTPRIRMMATIFAWLGFIGMLFYSARNELISGIYWVNLIYIIVLIGVGIAIFIGSVILLARNFPGKPIVVFAGAAALGLMYLTVEQFWIRDWLTAQF